MEQRLTTQQLEQIVAEVERLANRQQDELDRSQVEKILEELNLPPELLDDALTQVRRKEAFAQQQKRNLGIAIASVTALVIIIAGTSLFFQNKAATLAQITVSQDRISLVKDGSEYLQPITRGAEVVYRVTLNDAPVGEKLNLTCNWLDPTGNISHINRYDTKTITTSVWNTACRYQVPPSAPPGAWKVQILIGDRSLKQAPFEVQ